MCQRVLLNSLSTNQFIPFTYIKLGQRPRGYICIQGGGVKNQSHGDLVSCDPTERPAPPGLTCGFCPPLPFIAGHWRLPSPSEPLQLCSLLLLC